MTTFLRNLLVAVIAIPAGLFGVIIGWVMWRNWRQNRRMRSEDGPFELAREIAGRPSLEFDDGPVQVISFGSEEVARTIPALFRETLDSYREFITEVPDLGTHRYICFGNREQYAAYLKSFMFDPGEINGVSLQSSLRTIILAIEPSDHHLWAPEHLIRSTTVCSLFDLTHANRLDLWLHKGLCHLIGGGRSRSESLLLNRRVRAAIEAGRAIDGADYFDLTSRKALRLYKDWRDTETFFRITQFQQQSYSFLEFLARSGEFPSGIEGLRRFLAALRPKVRNATTFQEIYGRTPQDALAQWKRWVVSRADEDIEARFFDDDLRRLHGQLIPTARDASRLPFDRISAVRAIGLAGSWHAVRPLLRLLRDDNTLPKAEILWALENVTGRAFGDSLSAWNEWVRTHDVPDEPVDL